MWSRIRPSQRCEFANQRMANQKYHSLIRHSLLGGIEDEANCR